MLDRRMATSIPNTHRRNSRLARVDHQRNEPNTAMLASTTMIISLRSKENPLSPGYRSKASRATELAQPAARMPQRQVAGHAPGSLISNGNKSPKPNNATSHVLTVGW